MRNIFLFALLCAPVSIGAPAEHPADDLYERIPFYFERNDGQAERTVRYLARSAGGTFALTGREMILTPRSGNTVRLRLDGSTGPRVVEPLEKQIGVSNYIAGNDQRRWLTGVPHFSRVLWRAAYPGIDVVYYGREKSIEYDFIIAPGADPRSIALGWEGARSAKVDSSGDLLLDNVRLRRPRAYQRIDGREVDVAAAYRIRPGRKVVFAIGEYDRSVPLVIDPVLSFSTYLSGTDRSTGRGIAVDAAGNTYVTGYFLASSTATTTDVFVLKLNPGGTQSALPDGSGGYGKRTGGRPYFTDVAASHPLFKWIQKMRELGITSGCGTSTYCPDDAVTRGQMAVFILRALLGNTFSFAPTAYFIDVPSTHSFFPFVQKMKEWGVTTGCSASTYCVDGPTTRGQMAVFLIRAFFSPR